jgi:Flp pilus assembly protein TadG
MRGLKRFANSSNGSVIVIFALILVVLVGGAGLAIDSARGTSERQRLQASADAAALAGAISYRNNTMRGVAGFLASRVGISSNQQLNSLFNSQADSQQFVNVNTNNQYTARTPETTVLFEQQAGTVRNVRVNINRDVPTTLSAVLGQQNMQVRVESCATITARAQVRLGQCNPATACTPNWQRTTTGAGCVAETGTNASRRVVENDQCGNLRARVAEEPIQWQPVADTGCSTQCGAGTRTITSRNQCGRDVANTTPCMVNDPNVWAQINPGTPSQVACGQQPYCTPTLKNQCGTEKPGTAVACGTVQACPPEPVRDPEPQCREKHILSVQRGSGRDTGGDQIQGCLQRKIAQQTNQQCASSLIANKNYGTYAYSTALYRALVAKGMQGRFYEIKSAIEADPNNDSRYFTFNERVAINNDMMGQAYGACIDNEFKLQAYLSRVVPGYIANIDSGLRTYVIAYDNNCNEMWAQDATCSTTINNSMQFTTPISLQWAADSGLSFPTISSFAINPAKKGVSRFEWFASAQMPLVVYDPAHTGDIKDGKQLFGNHTFGKQWEHGYQALATLDADNNGKVDGKELAPLGLWFDANKNGISEQGEVKPITTTGVQHLYYHTKGTKAADGHIHLNKGYTKIVNGKTQTLPSVDWFASELPLTAAR